MDGVVQVVGYRALKPVRQERPSPASLTFGTMQAVAAAVGKPSDVRLSRGELRHKEKFMAWPLIGDPKAVAVRPRIYDHERAAAEKMLRAGGLKRVAA
jgi:hypothetical protein